MALVRYIAVFMVLFAGIPPLIAVGTAVRVLKTVPQIGHRISQPLGTKQTLCMVSSAQLDPCFESEVQGRKYTVAFNAHTKAVSRVSTLDVHFATAAGLHIGDLVTIRDISELKSAPYFETYFEADKDWYAVVGILDGVSLSEDGKSIKSTKLNELRPTAEHPLQLPILGFVKRQR